MTTGKISYLPHAFHARDQDHSKNITMSTYLFIRQSEQSACHWWGQKRSQELQLIAVNCSTFDVWIDFYPPWTISVLLMLNVLQTFFPPKDPVDFHGKWWISVKKGKLLPIWKANFKWLIYIYIITKSILIWIHFLFYLCATIIVTNTKQVLLFAINIKFW